MTQEIIKWDLSDFYKSINDLAIEKDIQDLEESAENFYQNVKGKLEDPSLTPKQLLEWYQDYEAISEKLFYFDTYSTLLYRINSLDDDVKSFFAKIDEFKVKIQEKLLFFDLELNQISDTKFEELINSPDLKNYVHALKFNRMKKPHQLHTQNILNHISNNYEEFTPSQGRVAQYIYDNAQEVFDIESEKF